MISSTRHDDGVVEVRGVSAGINVGTGEVRFGTTPDVGSRIRGRGTILSADEVKPGAVQTVIRLYMEVEGRPEAPLQVDAISRWLA